MEKDRELLIAECKYYKGEDENPFEDIDQNKAMLWFCESAWVGMTENKDWNTLNTYIGEYKAKGLYNFADEDNRPISLKALLMCKYGLWGDDVNPFKKFYAEHYL